MYYRWNNTVSTKVAVEDKGLQFEGLPSVDEVMDLLEKDENFNSYLFMRGDWRIP